MTQSGVMQQVLADLRQEEALRLHAYMDSEDVWTIGYGHTKNVHAGMSCTKEAAEVWLLQDIVVAAADLDRKCPWWTQLPLPAQCGLLNMCFNLGWPRLAGFHKMLANLQAGRFLTAGDEAQASKWARQVGDGPGGKFDRAERIAQLFRSCAEQSESV